MRNRAAVVFDPALSLDPATPLGGGTAAETPTGSHRYYLSRRVGDGSRRMLFIMLNPSTASATRDDATIRRCRGFAVREGCGWLEVLNLFAERATRPADLWQAVRDARSTLTLQVMNSLYWRDVTQTLQADDLVVAAFGAYHPLMRPTLIEKRRSRVWPAKLWCLGVCADGSPRHPLRLRADTPLEPWDLARFLKRRRANTSNTRSTM